MKGKTIFTVVVTMWIGGIACQVSDDIDGIMPQPSRQTHSPENEGVENGPTHAVDGQLISEIKPNKELLLKGAMKKASQVLPKPNDTTDPVADNDQTETSAEGTRGTAYWQCGRYYYVGDVVVYNGLTWVCDMDHYSHNYYWAPGETDFLWSVTMGSPVDSPFIVEGQKPYIQLFEPRVDVPGQDPDWDDKWDLAAVDHNLTFSHVDNSSGERETHFSLSQGGYAKFNGALRADGQITGGSGLNISEGASFGDRIRIQSDNDATEEPGTGAIEINGDLRIDENEIITNPHGILNLQRDNEGYVKIGHEDTPARVGINFPEGQNPTEALQVNGTIMATEVIVQADVPDYVFGKNYDLWTLEEVDAYLAENQHLPGVTSAAEANEVGGISMGDLQAQQLQKIEELTLHIIALNKRLKTLEKQSLRHSENCE